MTSPHVAGKVIYGTLGQRRRILACAGEGVIQVEQFLSGLPERAQAQFWTRFECYCEVGFLRNPDQMRRLQVDSDRPTVSEIKVPHGPGFRLFGVEEANRFIATHGAKKPKDRALKAHVKRARQIYADAAKVS